MTVEKDKVEEKAFGCCAGWQCASRFLISGVGWEAQEAVPESGGLVGELAVGRLAVPLQVTLALGLWEEGGSLAEL